MKRIISFVCVIALIACVFTGCSGGTKGADLNSVMNEINFQFGISGLTVVEDAAKLNRYYSIAEEDVKQFAAEFSTDASVYNELVLVEAADSGAAERIAELLANHLDAKISEGKSYNKEAAAMLENCNVNLVNDRYVILIINEEFDEMSTAVSELLAD